MLNLGDLIPLSFLNLNIGNSGLTGTIPSESGNILQLEYLKLGKHTVLFSLSYIVRRFLILLLIPDWNTR